MKHAKAMDGLHAVVVSSSSPELAIAAQMLSREGSLQAYVHPFLSTGRTWEHVASSLPFVGANIRRELQRRQMPLGIRSTAVYQAATAEELLRAALTRLPLSSNQGSKAISGYLSRRRSSLVARRGADLAHKGNVVLASHAVALPAFMAASEIGALKILNYPTLHHAERQRIIAEEALAVPAFACTLPYHTGTAAVARGYDRECLLADYILVGSTFARDSFVARGIPTSKLVILPYGVDTEQFKAPARPNWSDSFQVLFVGQLSQAKGISYLLEAYRLFEKPDSELVLVGNYFGDCRPCGPYEAHYRHIPHVPHSDLPAILSSATVLVFPSLFEGMGLVVLEAMSMGVPVITTPNGPGDLVRDGTDGFVVPIRDSRAIQERLDALYSSPALVRRMGERARERAADFTWGKYGSRLLAFLHSALATTLLANNP